MHVRERERNGTMICYLSGEVTIDTAQELKRTLQGVIDNKWQSVLLHLGGLEYIDSSGLAALVQFSIDLKNIQGVMVLSDMPPTIRSIFGITKLEKMFKIYETEEEAFKDLGKGAQS